MRRPEPCWGNAQRLAKTQNMLREVLTERLAALAQRGLTRGLRYGSGAQEATVGLDGREETPCLLDVIIRPFRPARQDHPQPLHYTGTESMKEAER